MNSLKKYLFPLLLSVCFGCKKPHTEAEIISAMKQYDRMIMKTNADSIALMYAVNGELGEIAKGRDSIKNFLQRFKNVRVLFQNSVTDSVLIDHDSCLQKGRYDQISLLNGKDTVKVKGSFRVNWVWNKKEGWKIKKMITGPLN